MRIEGVDKSGRPWWVESAQDIKVTICPNCRNPVAIINTNESQAVEKVIFYKSDQDTKGLLDLGEFEVERLREKLPAMKSCPWCGCNLVSV